MPIKPENRALYPVNWQAIREEVLARAENRCEQCAALNHTRIARGAGSDAGTYQTSDAEVFCAETGQYLGIEPMSDYEVLRMTDVVLTIAHLDHDPANNGSPGDRPNLRAWCQSCHLRYDAEHHAQTARATRRARKAIGELF